MKSPIFQDRSDAGRKLAIRVASIGYRPDALVLAIPRGGVPVAFAFARVLDLPLDVFPMRRLALPGHEEVVLGAIGPGGIRVLNHDVIREREVPGHVVDAIDARERRLLEERIRIYRGSRPMPCLENQVVILVDDGLATSTSMRSAVEAVRQGRPARLVVAVPVASPDAHAELLPLVDSVISLERPEPFRSVSECYGDFAPVDDGAVQRLLERSWATMVTSRRSTTTVRSLSRSEVTLAAAAR